MNPHSRTWKRQPLWCPAEAVCDAVPCSHREAPTRLRPPAYYCLRPCVCVSPLSRRTKSHFNNRWAVSACRWVVAVGPWRIHTTREIEPVPDVRFCKQMGDINTIPWSALFGTGGYIAPEIVRQQPFGNPPTCGKRQQEEKKKTTERHLL